MIGIRQVKATRIRIVPPFVARFNCYLLKHLNHPLRSIPKEAECGQIGVYVGGGGMWAAGVGG